jgi:hypothetical protein
MKKLLFLAIFVSKMAYSQDTCNCDRPAWSLSTNFQSITAEVSHIAQKTKIGFLMGVTAFPIKERQVIWQSDKAGDSYIRLGATVSLYTTCKLLHVDYKYSVHLLGGAVFTTESVKNDIYLSGGAELRIPRNTKMFFIRTLYPFDFRTGIIFAF